MPKLTLLVTDYTDACVQAGQGLCIQLVQVPLVIRRRLASWSTRCINSWFEHSLSTFSTQCYTLPYGLLLSVNDWLCPVSTGPIITSTIYVKTGDTII